MHEKIIEIAVRRGFLYPSFEIYGGLSGFYDYGPLGALLKKNIEDLWRNYFCLQEGFLEISSPTISPEEVFIASGHTGNFTDPIVECTKCGSFFRADHLLQSCDIEAEGLSPDKIDSLIKERNIKCPECPGSLGKVKTFNLMFKTYIGPGKGKVGYLRPETAQGMFILFTRLYNFYRRKLPFGVAQIGRAYRNEISPRQGLIRLREFTQAEVEIFIDPRNNNHTKFQQYAEEKVRLLPRDRDNTIEITARESVDREIIAHEFLSYYIVHTKNFLLACGIPEEKLRFRQHLLEEMAHYARDCWDAEIYTRRFGWIEVVGIADRTDYDLKAHEKGSGTELKAFREYAQPEIVREIKIEPLMNKLGPAFKSKAGDIAEKIRNLSPEEAEDDIKIELEGEVYTISREYFSIKETKKKITGEKFNPHVIEPSFGIDRILYSILETSYIEREGKNVLRISPALAPMKGSIFPLVKKEPLPEIALDISDIMKRKGIFTYYDENDSIGRRYARSDEAGIPYSITIDFDGIESKTVTLRDRDTTEQVRVKIDEVPAFVKKLVDGDLKFRDIKEAH
ncbi:MAG TPA: glycine--tRNA ligase [Euryarchaeota archaeon]|nr:glycine--tRNA ligase [archaeon BMS3Bbin15]HDL15473.1 glycine--tRNA ligase [Euryarchaeota archaeon]